ncbi:hypothetical protein B9Z55_013577 [Caenorhabditis nigoni]|uniref:Ufm1-specific protease n=2 Tax=Caenorhabditis nigoni TaxID=1611254 RepID=A0A2G5U2C4_9PELO|nr:hypothetical protein B9Z55_013577 [Caenorhabditis nigoni]
MSGSQTVSVIGYTKMAPQSPPATVNELWFIDTQAMFQNYANLRSFSKSNSTETQTTIGGVVFGRKARKQVIHVFFAYAEDLTESNLQFLESSLSSDIELVGNVNIDGQSTLIGNGTFTLQLSSKMLENKNTSEFLDQNVIFNNDHISMEGASCVSKVGFEWSLRAGREQEDVKSAAERLSMASFRFSYLNAEHELVIREHKPETAKQKYMDKFTKGALPYKDVIEFTSMQSLTRDTSNDTEDQKLVPTVKVTKDNKHFTRLVTIGEVVFPAYFGDSSFDLYKRAREALNRRANNTMMVTVNGIRSGRGVTTTTSATYLPPGWISLLHLQLPSKWTENEQRNYRIRLHKLFNLPSSKPCLRLSQSLPLHSESVRLTNKKLIREPHLSISNYQPVGVVTTVKGPYNYHHYMQDGIDDNGWGCAYRSFQTIWSWFILNGYTDKPVPSHRDIQQALVNIGDKEQKFVGSRQWIGSTEISYVFNELLKLECRFIATNSGAEVVERARELARHFETSGTPVMIGGNMLAHTILGVDFNEMTGETKFLILDPHYTGSEDIKTITSKGWCAWKPASFWSTDHFYNMVLAQPPTDTI